jgi:hypothetical protein
MCRSGTVIQFMCWDNLPGKIDLNRVFCCDISPPGEFLYQPVFLNKKAVMPLVECYKKGCINGLITRVVLKRNVNNSFS